MKSERKILKNVLRSKNFSIIFFRSGQTVFFIILPLGQLYTYREISENGSEKQKIYSGVFRVTFFVFHTLFFAFCISQHFVPELAFTREVKGFRSLFFSCIIKTRNLHEM